MSKTFTLQVVAPDSPAVTQEVRSAVLPGESGEFGVLPGHMCFLSTLAPGVMHFEEEKGRDRYFLAGGFVEVNSTSVTVLAEGYERLEDIDVEAARNAIHKAEEMLSNEETVDDEAARQSLLRAKARLKAAESVKPLHR